MIPAFAAQPSCRSTASTLRKSLFLLCPVLLTAALWGQQAQELLEKAPPEVDDALRARVTKFYQAMVDGKFRAAYDLVAEDSKDAFFNTQKQKLTGFEIGKISYSDNYTKARVVTVCSGEFTAAFGGAKFPTKMPQTSLWRIENGNWYWHIAAEAQRPVPSPMGAGGLSPGPDSTATQVETGEFQGVWNAISLSKTEIPFKIDAPGEDEVILRNNLKDPMQLKLKVPKVDGLACQLDKEQLDPGETARLHVKWDPPSTPPKRNATLSIRLQPSNQTVFLPIKFSRGTPAKTSGEPKPPALPKDLQALVDKANAQQSAKTPPPK